MTTGEIAAGRNVAGGMVRQVTPWYRQRWPWLLMSGPAIVVVAGFFTAYLAWNTTDGLVEDDYYTQGLTINHTLERDKEALAMGLDATARFGADNSRVRITFDSGEPGDGALRLKLLHPTRAGMDQTVNLVRIAPGLWEGALTQPARGLWHLQLDTPEGGWRIGGDWQSGTESVELRPAQSLSGDAAAAASNRAAP